MTEEIETTENNLTNEREDGTDNYVPTFTAAERKIAYLLSGIIGILGGVCAIVSAAQGMPAWLAVAGGAASLIGSGIASMFGVHYVGVSK